MKTLCIRVDEKGNGAAASYPVSLLFHDGKGWKVVGKRGAIPIDLGADPPADPSGTPFDCDRIRAFILAQPSHAKYTEIGAYLLRVLESSGIGDSWRTLKAKHRATKPGDPGLRTMIDVRPDTLRSLPWELLTDGHVRPFLDRENPFLRGAVDGDVAEELPPLRLLVVVGNAAEMEEETVGILAAVSSFRGRLECQLLSEPTPQELTSAVDAWRPHIFHFSGHADRTANADGLLVIGSQPGAKWQLTSADIAVQFHNRGGRLAVLNACRTDAGPAATSLDDVRAATWSVADAFRAAGFLAVIGMQADVTGEAAGRFGQDLYTELAMSTPLDLAVARARVGMYSLKGRVDVRDWALPTLTVSARPDRILAVRACQPPSTQPANLDASDEFKKMGVFVDRDEPRVRTWVGLDPEGFADHAPRGLVVVRGPKGIGKSWLIYHALRTCAVRGRSVRLTSLGASETRVDFVDLLRWIKNGNPLGSKLQAPLPQEPFSAFHHALGQVAQGIQYTAYEEADGVVAEPAAVPFDRDLGLVEERARILFDRFLEGLKAVAKEQPLILAIDQTEKIDESDFRDFVVPHLLKACADDVDPRVRVIVAASTESMPDKEIRSQQADAAAEKIDLDRLPKARFATLFTQYMLANSIPWATAKEKRDHIVGLVSADSWPPSNLEIYYNAVKAGML
jgi:hypothetical protein